VPSLVFDEMSSWVGLVDEIEDSADIAVTVLNDLINYDKIVMGSLSLELTTVSMLECVRNTVRPFQVQARERNIALKLKGQSVRFLDTLVCTVDVVKIEQVIRNLVCNALKFTPIDGEVTVSGEFCITAARTVYYCLWILLPDVRCSNGAQGRCR
jgi:signal transduction histidine kinase